MRKHQIWTPQNMENGYIDAAGRYRVFLPTHHRAYSNGYVLRAIVHYEYYFDEKIKEGFDVHHKDDNRLNDTKENLHKLSHVEHSRLHNRPVFIERSCVICEKKFKICEWRLKEKYANRGKYCSQECYKKREVSTETRDRMSESHKIEQWSREFKYCVRCGSTKYKHSGKGLCRRCYQIKYRGGD